MGVAALDYVYVKRVDEYVIRIYVNASSMNNGFISSSLG